MGKVSYRPKKAQSKNEEKQQEMLKEEENVKVQGVEEQVLIPEPPIKDEGIGQCHHENMQSTRVVGDMGSDYHVYIEDYVYTYLYQLAAADYTRESSAILIGQSYSDSKEILIKGLIPVCMDRLQKDSEWIDAGIIDEIEQQRKQYFKDQQIIGWMHMQPGYGTMLTMKEVKEHQNVFEGNGTVCMLVDAINKIETLFVYEEDELKEQTGYCMYYERNEQMQQYMLDHPFNAGTKEAIKDNVVNQFREIGKMRKAEYMQKKNLNFAVMIASIVLIALTAVIVKMNDDKNVNSQKVEAANSVAVDSLDETDKKALENAQALGENEKLQSQEAIQSAGQENAAERTATSEASNEANDEMAQKNEASETLEDSKESSLEYDTYVVEAGDTLADICYKQYGSAERSAEVAKFNGLDNTNALYVGQTLKMPK